MTTEAVGAPAPAGGFDTGAPVDRSEWLEWHRRGLGSSDAAAIVGLSRWASPYTVFLAKIGLLPDRPPTRRQRLGQLLEPVVATLFHEETGLYAVGEQTRCEHDEQPVLRCTVDGFASTIPAVDLLAGTHEIKTDARYSWAEVPVDIRAQCVWQLGVTGLDHCWLSVLHGGFNYEIYEISYDTDARGDWTLMRERAERLWFEHILTGAPPPVDGSDATARALAQLYPDHTPGQRVSLDHLATLIAERDKLKEREAETKARLKVLDNTLTETFGEAEVGTLDGEPVLTYRRSERRGYTVEPGHYRAFRPASKRDKEVA